MDDQLFKKCLMGLLIATICAGSYWLFVTSSSEVMVVDLSEESEIIKVD